MNKFMMSFLRSAFALSLLSALAGAFVLTTHAYAQDPPDACGLEGLEPCPGTMPSIWPNRSTAFNSEAEISGWNLQPLTDYEFVIVRPDDTVETAVVTTDEEGDLLGDNVRQDGEAWGSPYRYVTSPENLGIYEVRAYVYPWSGDLNDSAIASTTFYHNNFGN